MPDKVAFAFRGAAALIRFCLCGLLLLAPLPSLADGLRDPFEAALALDPELRGLEARRAEIEARRRGADFLLPGPAAVAGGYLTDELTEKDGYGDLEVELGVPVWLPGQAGAQRELADAELASLTAQIERARLAVAGEVRNAYWAWALADASLAAARGAVEAASSLARDSARQLQAGQVAAVDELLARVDSIEAEALQREAESALREARAAFLALTGREPQPDLEEQAIGSESSRIDPRIQSARLSYDVGRATLRVAEIEGRDNPELALVYQRERDASGEPWDDRIGVRIRFPFGHPPRNAERRAQAVAEMDTASAELAAVERTLGSERERARVALDEARVRQELSEQRYAALTEAASFTTQAFAGGQAALVETLRLRASLAAADAERRLATVALLQAVSRMNQAQGYEP